MNTIQLFGKKVQIAKGDANGFRCKICALRNICVQLNIIQKPCDTKTGKYQYFKISK